MWFFSQEFSMQNSFSVSIFQCTSCNTQCCWDVCGVTDGETSRQHAWPDDYALTTGDAQWEGRKVLVSLCTCIHALHCTCIHARMHQRFQLVLPSFACVAVACWRLLCSFACTVRKTKRNKTKHKLGFKQHKHGQPDDVYLSPPGARLHMWP